MIIVLIESELVKFTCLLKTIQCFSFNTLLIQWIMLIAFYSSRGKCAMNIWLGFESYYLNINMLGQFENEFKKLGFHISIYYIRKTNALINVVVLVFMYEKCTLMSMVDWSVTKTAVNEQLFYGCN